MSDFVGGNYKKNAVRCIRYLSDPKTVLVAQLVERSLKTPEISSSNPVIDKILSTKLSTNCIIEKTKIKK